MEAGLLHPVTGASAAATDLSTEDVTVVVPARDDAAGLAACLASVRRRLPSVRLVVVDDGSSDPAAVASVAAAHGADLRRRARSGGPAAARQEALASLDTPLVAFVDADVDVGATTAQDWAALVSLFADPRLAVVAPRVAAVAGPDLRSRYEASDSPLDLGRRRGPVRPGAPVAYVPAATVLCRTAALAEVGGFDPTLRYGEDVDLWWRLDEAGWRCRYEPSVEVHHPVRGTWSAWCAQRAAYGSAAAPLDARHRGAAAPWRGSPWSLGVIALTLAGRPLAAGTVGLGTAVALRQRVPALPAAEALRLVAVGHGGGLLSFGRAAVRPWWPLTVAAAAVWPRLGRRLALLYLASAADDWRRRRRGALPFPLWLPVRAADDVSYGWGVWRGVAQQRRAGCLAPLVREWPGRSGGWPRRPGRP